MQTLIKFIEAQCVIFNTFGYNSYRVKPAVTQHKEAVCRYHQEADCPWCDGSGKIPYVVINPQQAEEVGCFMR